MILSKAQFYSILFFSLLLLLLLFAFRTKPKDLIQREKTRSLNLQSTNVNILIQEARSGMSETSISRVQILDAQMEQSEGDAKIEILKDLSSIWYDENQLGISGHYAEEVAILDNSAEAWAIAGTTYALCTKRTEKPKEQSFCLTKSLEMLENAISLNPEEVSYQINKAVILAENPPKDNPMSGVQQLLALNKKYPKNVSVINNIAKFAIQTNQLDRAEQRLLGALELEPDNITTICLLANLYEAKGQESQALTFRARCNN